MHTLIWLLDLPVPILRICMFSQWRVVTVERSALLNHTRVNYTIPHSLISIYTLLLYCHISVCVCKREAWCWVTAVKGWVTTGRIILHPCCPHNRPDQYLTALKCAAISLASLPLSFHFHPFVCCSPFGSFCSIILTVFFIH